MPRAGTWIEIRRLLPMQSLLLSCPVRARGLKSNCRPAAMTLNRVVPRAGTWIEMIKSEATMYSFGVVPRAGTWIEIQERVYLADFLSGRAPCGHVD